MSRKACISKSCLIIPYWMESNIVFAFIIVLGNGVDEHLLWDPSKLSEDIG